MSFDNGVNNDTSLARVKKCVSCGARLVFSPENDCLVCEHCDSHYGIKKVPLDKKTDFVPSELKNEDFSKIKVAVKCLNCGAVDMVDSLNISHTCSFCGSSKITTYSDNQRYKPDSIVPFSYGENYVKEKFAYWVKKRKFVSRSFKKLKDYDFLVPEYVPCWLFDTNIETHYNGVLGYDEEETYTDGSGRTVTKTVTIYKSVSGKRYDSFKNITICADVNTKQNLFDKISPFSVEKIRVYDENYMAGCIANKYSIDIKDSWIRANKIIEPRIRENIIKDYGADRYKYIHLDKYYNTSRYTYTLLPIWKGQYTYKSKKYNIYVNGTTGKFSGDVPRKVWKIVLFILLIVALVIVFSLAMSKAGLGGLSK